MRTSQRSRRRPGCILLTGLIALFLLGAIGAALAMHSSDQPSSPAAIATTITQVATSAPTRLPTQKPTAHPTQHPSPIIQVTPSPTPIPPLSITFTTVSAGDILVRTRPGATLTIKVLYCSGKYATSQSLQGSSTADSNGDDEWTWNVETTCSGQATAYVTATSGGKTITAQAHFTT